MIGQPRAVKNQWHSFVTVEQLFIEQISYVVLRRFTFSIYLIISCAILEPKTVHNILCGIILQCEILAYLLCHSEVEVFFLKKMVDSCPFMRPLFWTSGDISSGVQSQIELPYLYLEEAYMI